MPVAEVLTADQLAVVGAMAVMTEQRRKRALSAGAITIPRGSPMGGILSGLRASATWGYPQESSKAARLAAYTGYVHACVSARAQRDAAARYELYDKRTGDMVPEDKAPIPYAFFRRPNPVMSEFFLNALICTWVNLCGTAPILKIRNAAGVPVMQWPLLPNRVTALYDPVDWVRYEYLDDAGAVRKIPGRDIIFYRWPHPTKLFDGIGALEGAGLFHDTDVMLWSYQREMFSKGPFASWILQYPEAVRTDTDTKQQIAERFEEIVGDRNHPAFPVVLDQGVEAKQFPVTNKGMEVPTINEEIKERIRSAFHVSKTILGEVPGESRANVEGAEYGFYRFTEAYLRMIAEENARSVLPEWDERYGGEYEHVMPEDKVHELAKETARVSSGVLTINEVREDEGWDSVPWGDRPRDVQAAGEVLPDGIMDGVEDDGKDAPTPVIAATADVQAQALNGTQWDSLAATVGQVKDGSLAKDTAKALLAIALPSVPAEQIAALVDGIVVKEPEPEPPPVPPAKPDAEPRSLRTADPAEIRRAKSKAFVAWQSKHEARVLVALRKILAAESDAVVAKVEAKARGLMEKIAGCTDKQHARSILKNRSAIDDMADMEAFAAEYKALNPHLVTLYTEAGTKAAADYGVTFEVNKKGLAKIANHLHKSTDAILKTTSEQIRATLEEGFLDGEGVEALSSRIRDLYDGISRGRALTIARTETVAPANDGTFQGYKQAGVERKEWIATDDELTRDTHAAAEARGPIPIDEDFEVGDDLMAYPGDERGSAENVCNCRCTIAGVMDEEN